MNLVKTAIQVLPVLKALKVMRVEMVVLESKALKVHKVLLAKEGLLVQPGQLDSRYGNVFVIVSFTL